ncbi:MAG: outer membrane lipoprotein carrier protein LolA [Parvularculaceae bacterium]
MLNAFLPTIAVLVAETAVSLGAPVAAPAPALLMQASETAAQTAVKESAPTAAQPAAVAPSAVKEPVTLAAATSKPDPAPAAALPFDGESDAAVADKALRYLEGLTTLSGDFVQTAPNGAVATGKFYLRRPGQIRFDYDEPSPITIVATGGLVYVENEELETTDSYPLKKTPLKFLLSKKIDIGDATLKSVERAEGAVAITYASADEETEGEITLILSAPALSIEQWAIRDPQGGVTVVALQSVVDGPKLENRLFRAPEAGGAFINK